MIHRLLLLLATLLLLAFDTGGTVQALSAADSTRLNSDSIYYDPTICGGESGSGSGSSSSGGITIDNAAAEAVAKAAVAKKGTSTGASNVGYALYDSTGKLVANYNDTFENYGASITKSLILVAYLKQLNGGTMTTAQQGVVQGMIEQSDNGDADTVYNHYLTNGAQEVQAVATAAGMAGFEPNTSDPVYVLGQSQVTANGFAKFFAKIIDMIPAKQQKIAETFLSTITPNVGLLQSGLPGTVYAKEGWKAEPDTTNPFGQEGAPYVVNQAGQFQAGGTTYGVAVTVAGAGTPGSAADEGTGEKIIQDVVSALISNSSSSSSSNQNQCSCSPGQGNFSGSDNEQIIWNYLTSKGLTNSQAAGVMGNLEQESSFDPQRIQGGGDSKNPSDAGSGGYGLAQWTPGSKITGDLSDNKITGAVYDIKTQLNLIWAQMEGSSPTGAKDILKGLEQIKEPGDGNKAAKEAAAYFLLGFESGTDPGGVRENNAVAILQKYAGGADSSTGGGGAAGCTSSSTSPNCQGATGDAKILCAAERYDPASYQESAQGNHFGGGNPQWIKQVCPAAGQVNGKITPSCYLDCSGLVNIAVYDAFGYNLEENTFSEVADDSQNGGKLWKVISFNQVQPGDLVQPAAEAGGHVEIIDHVQGKTLYTFGAHQSGIPQPDQVSHTNFPAAADDVYLQWVGPTSSK